MDTEQAPEPPRADPKNMLERSREYLQRNKIFFETLVAFFLSLMAVIVSVAQFIIAEQQTSLAKLQTEIARQQNLPQFFVNAQQEIDPTVGKALEDNIYITNHGGIVQGLSCTTAVYLDIEYFPSGRGEPKKIPIVVNDYYGSTFHMGVGTGLVLRIQGYRNNDKMVNLERGFMKEAQDHQATGLLSLRRYVRLQYKDIFGEDHTRYYMVPLITGGVPLSEQEGRAIFEDYKQSFAEGRRRDLDDLTPDVLLALARKH